MQSKLVFVMLFMLSFSVFHDSFISLIEKEEHTSIVHYMNDQAPSSECADFNEIHNMFHFMAIMTMYQNAQLDLETKQNIAHRFINYTPPLEETSHKPPIA